MDLAGPSELLDGVSGEQAFVDNGSRGCRNDRETVTTLSSLNLLPCEEQRFLEGILVRNRGSSLHDGLLDDRHRRRCRLRQDVRIRRNRAPRQKPDSVGLEGVANDLVRSFDTRLRQKRHDHAYSIAPRKVDAPCLQLTFNEPIGHSRHHPRTVACAIC